MENVSHKNNFSFLRVLAATLVIFSHSFSLLRYDQFVFLGEWGVAIFFLMSGYLITQSWLHEPKIVKFFWKRILRISPGLILNVLFVVLLIGPLNTSLSLNKYFTDPQTSSYVKNILIYPLQFFLPGVFTSNPSPLIINHSMWTLPVEFSLYIAVVLLGLLGLFKFKKLLIGILIAAVATFIWFQFHTAFYYVTIYDIGIPLILSYSIYFLIGSLLYLIHPNMLYRKRFLFIAFIPLFISFLSPYLSSLQYLAIPYIIMTISFRFPTAISYLKRHGDPSYGMYLFSMPIQQTLIHYFPSINPMVIFGITFITTMILGFLSWQYIESYFLTWKKYL